MAAHSIEDIKPALNYSIQDTCRALEISVKNLYGLRKRGVIRYYLRRADSAVRIKGSEILKFYNS